MKPLIIIQARTNSTRLPAKVLLPVAGMPLIVLAARRAANTGNDVIVATSLEASDDYLVSILKQFDITTFRGSLENTLGRFVSCLENYSEHQIVVRLTGDNLFPDGILIDKACEEFTQKQLNYLCINGHESGLPYGVSLEVTLAKFLREALESTESLFDLEHVTPYIRRKYPAYYSQIFADFKMGYYRCTVDNFDDYLTVVDVFEQVSDPISAGLTELLSLLRNAHMQPTWPGAGQKVVLGTVQLGLNYGITNRLGQPSLEEGRKILEAAVANGTQYIDTARAYGDSENILGQLLRAGLKDRLRLITKLDPFDKLPAQNPYDHLIAKVDLSVLQSCQALNLSKLDILLLHRASHRVDYEGVIWKRLLDLRSEGKIGSLGVSVQSPDELSDVLNDPDVELIQLPFNILDWRWNDLIPDIIAEKEKRSLTIHVRSSLLQGLLLSKDETLWRQANESNPKEVINWLEQSRQQLKLASITELCLHYVAGQSWVDALVLGVDTAAQLQQNLSVLSINVDIEQLSLMTCPKVSTSTLNPACWAVNA